ncbi:hypothetical protein QJS04_geneDACA012207 [Acorus gramineus]|uniref:Protein NO VEIN C-terminal domain-containing protein n=1 Tax=Acorus gramineus TaxID=55184 RepID=A0AAV9B8V3_ACOGR|nr:hypothetical protein QJS04_geneDACA012207 [Acorus gramineus]
MKISSGDIITYLAEFMEMSKGKEDIKTEKFLDYVAKKQSVSAKEKLGVRIQSLSLHIASIRGAIEAENLALKKVVSIVKLRSKRKKMNEGVDLKRRYITDSEKLDLDERFNTISQRIKSFSSTAKHIRFKYSSSSSSCSSSDDEEEEEEEEENDGYEDGKSTSQCYGSESSKRVSSCPYPSTIEERTRLGLKHDVDGGEESRTSRKKRKEDDRSGKCGSSKQQRKKTCLKSDGRFSSGDISLSHDSIEKFVSMWKDACQEQSPAKVLKRMLNFYVREPKVRKKAWKFFSSEPGVDLLNVAVASIRCGMLDSLYDTFLAVDEHQSLYPNGGAPAEIIEIGTSNKGGIISKNEECSKELLSGVAVDDIIRKVTDYFQLNHLMPRESEVASERQLVVFRMLRDLELWLKTQFYGRDFSSLGHGDFFEFLRAHMSLLPSELCKILRGGQQEKYAMEVSMLQHQLLVLLSQTLNNSLNNGHITSQFISMLLKKQFPVISFNVMRDEPDDNFLDLIKSQRHTKSSSSIHFSAALLQKRSIEGSSASSEKHSCELSRVMDDIGQVAGSLGFMSAKDAFECLSKAPMLSDLQTWSHWDLIFAPSLGPLLEWLMNGLHTKEVSCILTSDGKFIRIDQSVSVEDFLEAMIQGSSYQTVVKLLSLLSLYGGVNDAPLSLLKCHAQRAIDVIIKNSLDATGVDVISEVMFDRHPFQGHTMLAQHLNGVPVSVDPVGFNATVEETSELNKSILRTSKAVLVVARFILDCLGFVPSEFRCFAADILVSGLLSFTKVAPLAILCECRQTDERLMLHNIGLSLGIIEWVEDYHAFSNGNTSDLIASTGFTDRASKSSCSASKKHTEHTHNASQNHCLIDNKTLTKVQLDSTVSGTFETCMEVLESEAPAREFGEGCGVVSVRDANIHDATLVIESIRCDEFGMHQNLNFSESSLLKKQHARLGRALHCLSQELYSQDSHFVLELIQNADDNIYSANVDPTVVFILQANGIVVLNNELGFSAQNIRALCDVGNSTKKGSNAGYIGQKGIGFKSVFRVTDAPEIHSNGFHVKFDISEGQIGFVLPTVISPCDIDRFNKHISDEDDQFCNPSWNTCIVLPFRSKLKELTAMGMNSIMSMFSDLHPSLLLFLHRLKCIKFKNLLSNSLVVMKRETLEDGIVQVTYGKEKRNWLVVSQKLQSIAIRPDVKTTEIALAFTLQGSDNGLYKPYLAQQPVFAFLPLRTYGLKFILQGDFVLPSSREEVDGDSAWNQWLLAEFPSLFVNAERSFCALPCFQGHPGKAVTAYMSFVPLLGEVHGFFSHLPHMIISKLRTSNCLFLEGQNVEWVPPCRVLRGWDDQAQKFLPNSLLHQHLGIGYLNKDVILSDSLAKALGVQEYGPKILTDIILSICSVHRGIESLGSDWLSSWLNAIYITSSLHSMGPSSLSCIDESDTVINLRTIPFIPLSDGSYASVADGPIWLLPDASRIEGEHCPTNFPSLYAKLRIVNPLFYSVSGHEYSVGEAKAENVVRMLRKIGVQQLSAHEVIRTHILPSVSDAIPTNIDKNLMAEYLGFAMLHLQSACTSCLLEKTNIIAELQKKYIILTDHGYKCPTKEPIHFSKEFGNPFDICKLIDKTDMKWNKIDNIYLNHSISQSNPFELSKWREFLCELGVTDFVKINLVEKNIGEVLCNNQSMICKSNFGSVGSFVSDWESPELVCLLTTFSSNKLREKSKYLLEVLDKSWDDCFSAKGRMAGVFLSNGDKKALESSLMKSIRNFKWIASSNDDELHYPSDLFYDCQDVRSIFGGFASYAVPQVTSERLLKDIGFKTQVTLDDAVTILQSWRTSEAPLKASISQMSRYYLFVWSGLTTLKGDVAEEFRSGPSIFVPFEYSSRDQDFVSGMLLSPSKVYWHDPTGCVNRIKEVDLKCTLRNQSCYPCKTLATVYPNLHDFFVNGCGVRETPSFGEYIEILLQLSKVALPSQAAHAVFQVLVNWANDLKRGLVKQEDYFDLKQCLCDLENTVLPTMENKWVSLHPSFGLICWCDDEELGGQFTHSSGVNFLHFGELNTDEKKMLSGVVAHLMQQIGIPALSEMVSREAIFYGLRDSQEKASLVNWILPYAQRYIFKLHPDTYLDKKQSRCEKLSQLKVIVVEKLFYKHNLKGHDGDSKKRFECSCLLQENILYMTCSADSHSMFLELSRFFFNGIAEIHLANFLHMIMTMAESGSSKEQIEFFVINSQKVPVLPDGESIWSLSCLSTVDKDQNLPPSCAVPVTMEQNPSTYARKPSSITNWPPTGWKTAPDFHPSLVNHPWNRPGPITDGSLGYDHNRPPLEGIIHTDDQPVPFEIEEDWITQDDSSTVKSTLQDSKAMKGHSQSVEKTNIGNGHKNMLVSSVSLLDEDMTLAEASPFTERETLHFQPANDEHRRTGRLGELVAYKYFTEKLRLASVRWVNQETETGLPYDLTIGENEENRQYVEVKASKSARKDWFAISVREWQFAAEKGDLFSVAHVVLADSKKAKVTVLKNPLKLCQQKNLQLAVLMSRGSAVTEI